MKYTTHTMNTKSCIRTTCGKIYQLCIGEVNRKNKKGTPFYCSLPCSGKNNTSHLKEWTNSEKNKSFIASKSGNKRDEYSMFRETLKRCRSRNKEIDITVEDLKYQWDKQNGMCFYLNQPLILPLTTGKEDKTNPNLIASLDRIDSSKGYVKENIQFISQTLNYAKNKFSEDILLNLFDMIESRCYDK